MSEVGAGPRPGGTVEALHAWWEQVSACALVGTARRSVPEPVPLLGSEPSDLHQEGPESARTARRSTQDGPEVRLLDQLALGAAWRSLPTAAAPSSPPLPPAPEETLPLAPARALQILELVLTQPVAGREGTAVLVGDWVETAAARAVRVPPALVPALLDHAVETKDAEHTAVVLAAVGERGRWLAALDPQWRRLLRDVRSDPAAVSPPQPVDERAAAEPAPEGGTAEGPGLPADWQQRPLQEQLPLLVALRDRDPDRARAAVAQGYRSGSARERAAYLEVLEHGLGPEDEGLLEQALGDRGAAVRDVAARLLDGLPSSARAARMAERLRPLVSVTRRGLRRQIVVTLPDTPDTSGARDGLGRPPPGRSVRGHHLGRIIAGAPLDVWYEITGVEPDRVLWMLADPEDVVPGLRRAAAAQRDRTWARALLDEGPFDPALLVAFVPETAEELVAERLGSAPAQEGPALLGAIPGPWGPALTAAALTHIMRAQHRDVAVRLLAEHAPSMHVDSLPALQAAVERMPFGATRERAARAVTIATLRQSISEAFT